MYFYFLNTYIYDFLSLSQTHDKMTDDTEERRRVSLLVFRFLVLININIASIVLWNQN